MRFLLLLGLWLSLINTACTPSSEPSRVDNGVPYYDFDSDKETKEALEKFELSCLDSSCPKNVGALLIKDGNSIGTCTFSMITEDIALTNRHCVPDSIAFENANCQNNIRLIYNIDGQKEIAKCAQVITVPDEYKSKELIQRDYAFIRVKEKFKNSTFQVDTSGSEDGATVYAITATPKKHWQGLGSEVQRKKCNTSMNSLILPSYNNKLSPMFAVVGCEIIPGNSGSPLLNSMGKLIGVVQNTVTTKRGDSSHSLNVFQAAFDFKDKVQEKIKQVKGGHATNAACFKLNELGLNPWSDYNCITSRDLMDREYSNAFTKTLSLDKINFDLAKEATAITDSNDELQIKLRTTIPKISQISDAETYHSVLSICLKGSEQEIPWLSKYVINSRVSGVLKYQNEVQLTLKLPKYTYDLAIDDSLKLVFKTQKQTNHFKIHFNLHEFLLSESKTISATIKEVSDDEALVIKLSLCN